MYIDNSEFFEQQNERLAELAKAQIERKAREAEQTRLYEEGQAAIFRVGRGYTVGAALQVVWAVAVIQEFIAGADKGGMDAVNTEEGVSITVWNGPDTVQATGTELRFALVNAAEAIEARKSSR